MGEGLALGHVARIIIPKPTPTWRSGSQLPRKGAAHRLWCVRALRSRNQRGSLPDANVRKKLTRDSGYGKGGAVWNDQRRRRRGLQGRPQKAAVGRGLLLEWFSVLRNSVAVHAHTPAMAGRQVWGRVAPC